MAKFNAYFLLLGIIFTTSIGFSQNLSGVNHSTSLLEIKADSLSNNENYFVAIDLYENALKQYKISGDYSRAGKVLEKLANIYSYLDDYSSALNAYIESLKIAELHGDEELLQSIYYNIGIFHLKLNNTDQALEYLFNSLDIINRSDIVSQETKLDVYMSLGTAYANKGINNSAIDYYNKALLMAEKSGNIQLHAGILNNIGSIHMSEGNYQQAEKYYSRGLELFESIQHKRGIGLSNVNIASIHANKQEYTEAIKGFETAIVYFDSISAIRLLNQTYKYLSNSYQAIGQDKQALIYLNKHIQLKDSILNNETLEKLNTIRNSYIEEKARQESKILEKQNQILVQESKLRSNRFIIVISSLILILIVAGFYIYRQQTRIQIEHLNQQVLSGEKEKLKDELMYKSKELESLAIHIVRKNDFVKKLKEETKELSDANANQKIHSLTKMIDKQIYLDKDRKDFELYVNQLHQSFFHKLDNNYPNLTDNDKKLCSLLLLGLDSNEIASIQNISSVSVKKARYRLRKKLDLDGDVNLGQFLKNL